MEGQSIKYNYGTEVSTILEHKTRQFELIKGNWNALWHKSLASLKDGTSLLFQYIFELEHGNNWRNVIYKTPEWTLTDIIMILKIHGQTFVNFGASLSILKQIIIISELYKDGLNNLTAENTLKISKVINDFLKSIQKHGPSILTTSNYKPSVDIVVARELLKYNVEMSNQVLTQCMNEFTTGIEKEHYSKNSCETFNGIVDGKVSVDHPSLHESLSLESEIVEDIAMKVHNFQLNAKAPEFIPKSTLNNYNTNVLHVNGNNTCENDGMMQEKKSSVTKLKYSMNNDFNPSFLKSKRDQENDNEKYLIFKKEDDNDAGEEALNVNVGNYVDEVKWSKSEFNGKWNENGWGDDWL